MCLVTRGHSHQGGGVPLTFCDTYCGSETRLSITVALIEEFGMKKEDLDPRELCQTCLGAYLKDEDYAYRVRKAISK